MTRSCDSGIFHKISAKVLCWPNRGLLLQSHFGTWVVHKFMSPILTDLLHGLESAASPTVEDEPTLDLYGTIANLYGDDKHPHRPNHDFNHSDSHLR